MKIFEYKPNLGTFSLGLERFSQNEVVEVLNLSQIAHFSYNNTHKQWFLPDFQSISSYEPKKSFDLAILNPDVGEKIGRRGASNIKTDDLNDCLSFLERIKPKFAIITTNINVIELLNDAPDYVRDGFGEVSKDRIIYSLQQMGYKPYLVALDEATYGVPTHKDVAMYIATPKDFEMSFPIGLYSQYGRGKYNKFRTIADAIGDLGNFGEWVPYKTAPQNAYQRYVRRNLDHTTWHFLSKKLSDSQIEKISHIPQGSNARKAEGVRSTRGYVRPKWDQICPGLDEIFYRVSSDKMSVHPIANRTLTMREGMRIMGLPDNVSFELTAKRVDMGKLISEAIAPIIGEATAIALKAIQ